MAKSKADGQTDGPPLEPTEAPTVDQIANALQALDPRAMKAVMERVGQTPSSEGFSIEQLQMVLEKVGTNTAIALKKAGQRENPDYPARSVFNPRGKYDDDGKVQAPKLTFKYDTYFVNVLIGRAGMTDDLSTEQEIELYNRFERDMSAMKDTWTARFAKRGSRTGLFIDVPHEDNDDRMGLPPLTTILLTLLEGEATVNPANMLEQMKTLQRRIDQLEGAPSTDPPVDVPQGA